MYWILILKITCFLLLFLLAFNLNFVILPIKSMFEPVQS